MKGSISKYVVKGSSRPRWRYRLRIGKDGDGTELREGRAGFAKEGDARQAMRGRIEEIERERNTPAEPPVAVSITLGEWVAQWIETYAVTDCERTTVQRYRQLLRYITEAKAPEIVLISQTPIKALEKMHGAIQTAMYTLLNQKARRRAHLSPRSVGHVAALLSVALNEAFDQAVIDVNPMLRVKLPKVPKKKAVSLTEDQFRELRKTCRGDWTFVFIEVVTALGGRRGEALALRWADLNWSTSTVTISRSLAQTKDDGIFVKVTKEDEIHEVQLNPSTIAALQIWRDQQSEYRRKFGEDYSDRDLIFATPDGSFLNPAYISQTIKRRLKKAGITVGSLHSLRHTNASQLHHKKIPMATISKRLGHSDLTTTERIYTHAVAEDDRRAAEAWEEIIQAADAWEGVTPAKGPVQ